jgi:hypothetical protein
MRLKPSRWTLNVLSSIVYRFFALSVRSASPLAAPKLPRAKRSGKHQRPISVLAAFYPNKGLRRGVESFIPKGPHHAPIPSSPWPGRRDCWRLLCNRARVGRHERRGFTGGHSEQAQVGVGGEHADVVREGVALMRKPSRGLRSAVLNLVA